MTDKKPKSTEEFLIKKGNDGTSSIEVDFHIVGVGASAGGTEAISALVRIFRKISPQASSLFST